MDIQAYLKRINYDGPLAVNAETLKSLQAAHLLAVPFENLSIHSNEMVVLDDAALFEKIVIRKRGGFCYELNGLFAALLRALGFTVTMLSASVADDEEGYKPEFGHMTLLVALDEQWLVDVGFGDSFREPLRLNNLGVQRQQNSSYLLIPQDEAWVLMESKGEQWKPQYKFTNQSFEYADFAEMCHFQQASPTSYFRKAKLCTRTTPAGRLTLTETSLITTPFHGERDEKAVSGQDEFEFLLGECFGIRAI